MRWNQGKQRIPLHSRERWVETKLEVVRIRGEEFICLCPFCADEKGHLWVNPGRGLFRCWRDTCNASGTFFQLVRRIEGKRPETGQRSLASRFGEGDQLPILGKRGQPSRPAKPVMVLPPGFKRFTGAAPPTLVGKRVWEYLRGRRLSAQVIEEYGLGYSPDPKWAFRAIMPVWRNGKAVGFTGRHIGNGEPKYYTSPGLEFGIYGIEGPEKIIVPRGVDSLLFVEGPFDVYRAPGYAIAGLGIPLSSVMIESGNTRVRKLSMEESRLSVLICDLEPREIVFVLDLEVQLESVRPLARSVGPFIKSVKWGRPKGAKDFGAGAGLELMGALV